VSHREGGFNTHNGIDRVGFYLHVVVAEALDWYLRHGATVLHLKEGLMHIIVFIDWV
jgi:hypothetical protein